MIKIEDDSFKKITVSENFKNAYKNFNVFNVAEKISNLSKKELYLLLICCIDNHDSDDSTVMENYSNYEVEIAEILDLQDSKKTLNNFLLELIFDTESITIDSHVVKLPKIYTKEEVRELKLNKILDK